LVVKERETTMLDHLVGLVKVRVLRGVNLAIRGLRSSDPYVVVRIGKQVRSRLQLPSFSFPQVIEVALIYCWVLSGKRSVEFR
jgi:hypothetical protein